MKKKKTNFLKRNRYMVLLSIVFAVYVSTALINQELQYRKLLAEEAAYLTEIENLNEEIERLESRLENNQDPQAIEKIAREKLKMVKPNEIIYIIQENAE
jgi:cell division protein FtsL